jgi:hypothetical protein
MKPHPTRDDEPYAIALIRKVIALKGRLLMAFAALLDQLSSFLSWPPAILRPTMGMTAPKKSSKMSAAAEPFA